MNGSRRNEADPRPPWPARTFMCAESTKVRERPLFGDDADPPAVLTYSFVSNQPRGECEEVRVASQSYARAGSDFGAALPHEDRACVDGLSAGPLHAQHLRLGVASVA